MPGRPPVAGPPVGAYRPRRGTAWVVGAVVASIAMFGFAWLRGGGAWLASSWVPWALVLAPAVLIAVTAFGTSVAVWPEWLYVRELWYRRWLRLDELTEVDLRPNGPTLRIRLRDRRGNKVVTALSNLREEPAVWQVVHPALARALASPECRRNTLADRQLAE